MVEFDEICFFVGRNVVDYDVFDLSECDGCCFGCFVGGVLGLFDVFGEVFCLCYECGFFFFGCFCDLFVECVLFGVQFFECGECGVV